MVAIHRAARVAPIATKNSGSLGSNTPTTMGRMRAMVPQLVPIEKPMNAATKKMANGSRVRLMPNPFRKPLTNGPVPIM